MAAAKKKAARRPPENRTALPKKTARHNKSRKVSSANTAEAKRPVGRPTDYRPELCDEVVAWCRSTGKSLTAFAGSIGTSRDQLNHWAKANPEFRLAMDSAKAARSDLLETQVMTCTNGPAMQARLLALKNSAPEDWVDRTDHRLGGLPDSPPIGVAQTQVDTSNWTPQQVFDWVASGKPLPPSAKGDA